MRSASASQAHFRAVHVWLGGGLLGIQLPADVDGTGDHDFVGLYTPFPDAPLRGRVLGIPLSGPEESIYRSPNVLYELGQSNGIVQGRFVADLYLSLELAISRPLIDERVTESSVIVDILRY
jgi:hypothetical protein